MNARPQSRIPGYACLGAASISLIFLSWVAVDSVRAARSVQWPQAAAYIIRSDVRAGQGRSAGRYFADVQYTYMAAGEVHYASRITFGEDPYFRSSAEAAAFMANFPVSGTVPVHYSSSFPETSVLLPGQLPSDFKWRIFPFTSGFVVFFVSGLLLLRARSNPIERTDSGRLRRP